MAKSSAVAGARDTGIAGCTTGKSAKGRTGNHVGVGRISDDGTGCATGKGALALGFHAARKGRCGEDRQKKGSFLHVVLPPSGVFLSPESSAD